MKTEKCRLIQRYASAFLNVFMEELSVNSYGSVCDAVHFFSSKRSRFFLLGMTYVDTSVAREVMAAACEKFKLGNAFKKLIDLLIKHRRLALLPGVMFRICTLYRKRNGIVFFRFTLSHAICEKSVETLRSHLEKLTGYQVWCSPCCCVDRSLIAGMRAQSDNLLWEYSLRDKIKKVERLAREQV